MQATATLDFRTCKLLSMRNNHRKNLYLLLRDYENTLTTFREFDSLNYLLETIVWSQLIERFLHIAVLNMKKFIRSSKFPNAS